MSENDNNSGDDQSTYETPATTSEEAGTPSGPELAGRGRRLGGYMIDTIIAFSVLVPIAYFNPGPLGVTMLDIVGTGTRQMSVEGVDLVPYHFYGDKQLLACDQGTDRGQMDARYPHCGCRIKRC